MEAFIRIRNLSRSFGSLPAVQEAALDMHPGVIHALTGESGAGKSTLLRLIAGFETPDKGSIQAGERVLTDSAQGIMLPAEKRRVGLVFQENALFPHLTVAQNIGYGVLRRERDERVRELLGLVHLRPYAGRYPHQISGGQAQRVALARALAPHPDLLLMDEPFSSLDRSLKKHLLPEITAAIKAIGMPTLFVSHDRDEVFDLADSISIMQGGCIIQTGEPRQLYEQPLSCYVAEFFGEANFLHDSAGTLMIRPEHIRMGGKPALEDSDKGSDSGQVIAAEARILEEHYRGNHNEYWVEVDNLGSGLSAPVLLQIRDHHQNSHELPGGEVIRISFSRDQLIRLER